MFRKNILCEMGVFGEFLVYGQDRTYHSHLVSDVLPNSKIIEVHGNMLDWKSGERIVITSTSTVAEEYDDVLIESVDYEPSADISIIRLQTKLKYYHDGHVVEGVPVQGKQEIFCIHFSQY